MDRSRHVVAQAPFPQRVVAHKQTPWTQLDHIQVLQATAAAAAPGVVLRAQPVLKLLPNPHPHRLHQTHLHQILHPHRPEARVRLTTSFNSAPPHRPRLTSPTNWNSSNSVIVLGSQIPGVAAGASANTTYGWTPPSAGTWYARSCADNNTSWVGLVTEVDENNNCSPIGTFVVTADGQPTCTLTASPKTIQSGQSTTLSWTTTGATSFSIDRGIGSVTPSWLALEW